MNLDNHQSIDVVALSWKLLDWIKQTRSPFSTLPDMCIYRPRSQCVWRNISIIIVDYDLKCGHCSFSLSLSIASSLCRRYCRTAASSKAKSPFCTNKRKNEQHIIEPRQQERVQQLFIHHWYKKKTEDKQRKIARCCYPCSLSLSLCLSVDSSVLSADTTTRDDCQLVLNTENYMVNHWSWDTYIFRAVEERKKRTRHEKRGEAGVKSTC